MSKRRNSTEQKAAQPTGEQPSTGEAAAPAAAAPAGKDKNEARFARLEKQVAALHALLHEHGIRHKAVEPATTE